MFRKKYSSALTLLLIVMISACAPTPATVPATAAPTAIPPTTSPSTIPATAAPTEVPATATNVPATPTAVSLAITDATGRKVTLTAIPQRIISLAPSNTEILFALDLGSSVVAVDTFSDFPAEAKALPKITGADGKPNFEQIVALKPDVVFAAGITSPEDIKKLEDLKIPVVVLGPEKTTFDTIFSDIALAGEITGRDNQAKRVTDAMRQKLDAIKARVATAQTKRRVYWELDATDPAKPFTVGPGNFVNDIIALAGGTNVFSNASSTYPQVGSEQVVTANPEVIILSDAAYGVAVDSVLKRPGWQGIDAVKKKQVYPIEDALVSRPGPRVVDGLEAAAKLIHPELFP